MFHRSMMQRAFPFATNDIARWHRTLLPMLAGVSIARPRVATAQLIKSMISARTRDAVSLAAFERLRASIGTAGQLAKASVDTVTSVIADVTFPEAKAANLIAAMQLLRAHRRSYDLQWLGAEPLDDALAFLEQLPGVGRKVSASTLNSSTLAMPVMIVDTHVLRVLRRIGAVDDGADYRAASETVTSAMPAWSGATFLEFHVLLKLLGQTLCRPLDPQCSRCPLRDDCAFRPGR